MSGRMRCDVRNTTPFETSTRHCVLGVHQVCHWLYFRKVGWAVWRNARWEELATVAEYPTTEAARAAWERELTEEEVLSVLLEAWL